MAGCGWPRRRAPDTSSGPPVTDARLRLYLVRHGAVAPERPGTYYGGIEVPLSPAGEQEAQRAAEALKNEALDRVLCSPLGRARYGARCIAAGRGLVEEPVAALAEIARGRWIGLTAEEVRARLPGDLEAHFADPDQWRGHGGESLGDLRRRVLGVRDRLLEGPPAAVAIVAHLHPIRAVLADALGLPLQRWEELSVPTGSVAVVDYPNGHGELRQMPWKP